MTNTPAPELVEKVCKELFVNLSHYRPGCFDEHEDAKEVLKFFAALSSIPPTPEISEQEAREILNRTPHAAGCSATLDTGTGQLSCDCDRALRALQQSTRAPDRDGVLEEAARVADEERRICALGASRSEYAAERIANTIRALKSTPAEQASDKLATINAGRATTASETMREALIKCRDRFREYEALQQAKAEKFLPYGSPPVLFWESEAARNREMAELCEAALSQSPPEQPREGV